MSYGDKNWQKQVRHGESFRSGTEDFINYCKKYGHTILETGMNIDNLSPHHPMHHDRLVGARQLEGKFWMVQQDLIESEEKQDERGADHARVLWGAKVVFGSKQEAVECAETLSRNMIGRKYFVMEAVSYTVASEPKTKTVNL